MAIRYVSVNGYNEHELVRDVWQEHVQAGLWEIMQDSVASISESDRTLSS